METATAVKSGFDGSETHIQMQLSLQRENEYLAKVGSTSIQSSRGGGGWWSEFVSFFF
jgi:hypothetical protein